MVGWAKKGCNVSDDEWYMFALRVNTLGVMPVVQYIFSQGSVVYNGVSGSSRRINVYLQSCIVSNSFFNFWRVQ